MKIRWWFLQAFVLVVGASAVMYWPVRPVWELQNIESRWLVGFNASGDRLLLASPLTGGPVQLQQVETANGNVCETCIIPCDVNWRVRRLYSIGRRTQIMVLREYVDPPNEQTHEPSSNVKLPSNCMSYEILDIAGKNVAGPFQYRGSYHPEFSPDGKWLWTSSDDGTYLQQLIEVATGTVIRSYQETTTHRPLWNARFAPDGSAVAVPWYLKSGQLGVEILDLPSGTTRFSQAWPAPVPPTRSMLCDWHGDRLYALMMSAVAPGLTLDSCHSLQVGTKQLENGRDETDLSGFTDHRGNTLSAYRFWRIVDGILVDRKKGSPSSKPAWLATTLEWIDKKCGTTLNQPLKATMQLQFHDMATGKLLGELSSPRMDEFTQVYSPQAKYVASEKQTYPTWKVSLWDTRPVLRWPWAVGTGVLGVLLVRWFAEWRRVKQIARAHAVA